MGTFDRGLSGLPAARFFDLIYLAVALPRSSHGGVLVAGGDLEGIIWTPGGYVASLRSRRCSWRSGMRPAPTSASPIISAVDGPLLSLNPLGLLPIGDSQLNHAGRAGRLLRGKRNAGREVWPLRLTLLLPLGRRDSFGAGGVSGTGPINPA